MMFADNRIFKVFLSPCGDFHDRSTLVFNGVPSKGLKVMGNQLCVFGLVLYAQMWISPHSPSNDFMHHIE